MEVAGASPLARFSTRGTGSAGLGRGEIRSTSATGRGSTIVLDLKEERGIENLYFFGPIMVNRVEINIFRYALHCSFARFPGFGITCCFLHLIFL